MVASISAGEAVTIEATVENPVEALQRTTQSTNRVIALDSFIGADFQLGADRDCDREQTGQAGRREYRRASTGHAGFLHGERRSGIGPPKALDGPLELDPVRWRLAERHASCAREVDLGRATQLLDAILPGLSSCLRIEYRGSWSCVVNGSGQQNPGPTHALVQVSHPEFIDRLRAYVQIQVVLQGLSFRAPKHSKLTPGKIVAQVDLTIFDLATWVLGRLVFNSVPDVTQAPGFRALDADVRIINPNGGILDIGWITAPDAQQVKSYAVKSNRNVQIDDEFNDSLFVISRGRRIVVVDRDRSARSGQDARFLACGHVRRRRYQDALPNAVPGKRLRGGADQNWR